MIVIIRWDEIIIDKQVVRTSVFPFRNCSHMWPYKLKWLHWLPEMTLTNINIADCIIY